jgi:DhnA family fructose-bisphosphate aldolase class Ia
MELGADAVKLKYNADRKGFEWVVKAAGQCKVLAADPEHKADLDTLRYVHDAVQAGGAGVTLGKTVWQHHKPFSLTRALHAVIFKGKSPEEALKYLE